MLHRYFICYVKYLSPKPINPLPFFFWCWLYNLYCVFVYLCICVFVYLCICVFLSIFAYFCYFAFCILLFSISAVLILMLTMCVAKPLKLAFAFTELPAPPNLLHQLTQDLTIYFSWTVWFDDYDYIYRVIFSMLPPIKVRWLLHLLLHTAPPNLLHQLTQLPPQHLTIYKRTPIEIKTIHLVQRR